MIRLIREGSQNYPWLLKGVVLVLAVTFVVGMGWFGFDQAQQSDSVALVGTHKISIQHFRRAYNNTYRFYKDQLKQKDIDEESLKQTVLNGLIDSKLWLVAAGNFGLAVSPEELKHSIMTRQEFQKDGAFDPQFYHRLLATNHLSPREYESQRTQDLLSEKAQLIVQDVVSLTQAETEEVEALASRQTGNETDGGDEAIRERIKRQLLFQKKQRALQAFQANLRGTAKVEIHEEFL